MPLVSRVLWDTEQRSRRQRQENQAPSCFPPKRTMKMITQAERDVMADILEAFSGHLTAGDMKPAVAKTEKRSQS